jgi:uncharacterized protein YbjT (DUF2867 family)
MILITGATGNIGRKLARALDSGGAGFRVLVRDLTRAEGLPSHAERFAGDLAKPPTLTAAFAGVDELFLLTQGIGTDLATNAIAAATAAGVRHVVFVSSYSVAPEYLQGRPMPAMARWHHEREQLLRASGIPTTFLRPGGFMTNALDWLPTIRDGGYVLDPIGPGRYAPIDPADIAAVAALTLTERGHEGAAYPLTGDELFTVAEQVRILGSAIGRELRVREVATPEEAVAARFPGGAPPALAAAVTEGFKIMRTDTAGFRTDVASRLLGRRAGTFAAWCGRHASRFGASS